MSVCVGNATRSKTFRSWAHKQVWEISGQQEVTGRHQWAQDVGSDHHNRTFNEAMSGEMVDKDKNLSSGARIARYFLLMIWGSLCNKGFYHKLHSLSNLVRMLFAEGSWESLPICVFPKPLLLPGTLPKDLCGFVVTVFL